MKKSNNYWVGYNREGNIIQVKVEDTTGRKLDHWSVKMNDAKSIAKMMRILKDKYNFSPEINNSKMNEDEDELKWLLGQD